MRDPASIDKTERDNWNAEANRRTKRWLIWTLLLLVVAYFLPLRLAVLLALVYARLADPDLKLESLPFAFPLPLLFRPPRRNTVYATSVVLKDESSGDTRARLHILDNGEPALSLYSESGDETAVFTSGSEAHRAQGFENLDNETRALDGRLSMVETEHGRLETINETLREVQSRIEKLEREQERENDERNEKVSSHCFELVDGDGNVRARLGNSSDDQPRLVLYDRNNLGRASLSLGENSFPKLFLTNLHEDFPSPTEGGKTRGRMVFGFDDDGYPQLLMYDDPDPKVGGLDPALSLAVRKAEWVGQQDTRYQSKEAGLFVRAFGRCAEKVEFFGARVAEPAAGDSA